MSHSCELLYIIRIFNYEVFLDIYISSSLMKILLVIVLMSSTRTQTQLDLILKMQSHPNDSHNDQARELLLGMC